jgi:L-alanine-DL-glutamate epimerase-like enolase superfamily enzyme
MGAGGRHQAEDIRRMAGEECRAVACITRLGAFPGSCAGDRLAVEREWAREGRRWIVSCYNAEIVVVVVAVVVAVTGAAAVVVGVAVWQMLGAQHQGTSLAIAMRGGGRWRKEGEGGGR